MKAIYILNRIVIIGVLVILLCNFTQRLFAQEQPAILKIFEKYGSRQGVTLLEISEELMKDYEIKYFKSIVFKDGTRYLTEIRQSISKDKVNSKLIKESVQDGLIISGYYRLKTNDNTLNRYLIFKVGKNNKVTLIYIEGRLTPEQLVELLK